MYKKLLSLLLAAALLAVPISTWAANPPTAADLISTQTLEQYLKENLPFGDALRSIASQALLQSGQSEREGVYYTEDGLVENYYPQQPDTVRQTNAEAIITFAQQHDVPVASAVIPTAAAVKQKLLPDNAPLYNQKETIAEIGRAMEGKVTVTDVYSTLYQHYDENEEYLYYRTDTGLTTLGGFRVYEALGERLHLSPEALRSFSKEYLVHDYYGTLTESWGENWVQSDILTVFTAPKQQFHLKLQRLDGTTDRYDTLYPTDRMEEEPFSIFLGGECKGFELSADGAEPENELLIFGDSSVQSVAPFLAGHYDRITYCNLEAASRADLREMDLARYDQVLFLYSVETFCDSQCIRKISVIP